MYVTIIVIYAYCLGDKWKIDWETKKTIFFIEFQEKLNLKEKLPTNAFDFSMLAYSGDILNTG